MVRIPVRKIICKQKASEYLQNKEHKKAIVEYTKAINLSSSDLSKEVTQKEKNKLNDGHCK